SAAFFAAGVAERMIGPAAPWFVLAAILLGAALRAIDLESCALFIPGGAYGTVKYAFGKGPARLAASAALVEGILFAALAASVAGYATATAIGFLPRIPESPQQITLNDVSTTVAVCPVGAVWWWLRQGRFVASTLVTRTAGAVAAGLTLVVVVGLIAAASHSDGRALLAALRPETP